MNVCRRKTPRNRIIIELLLRIEIKGAAPGGKQKEQERKNE